MNDLQLANAGQRDREWWYVRPELLGSLIGLLLICVAVWLLTRVSFAELGVISCVTQGAELVGRLGDYTAALLVDI
jgi:hypothetical protein